MLYPLLAIDVDGTLLNDQGRLTQRTQESICCLKETGSKIILATGRTPSECLSLIRVLDLVDPIITHNGAVIYHPTIHQAIFHIGFTMDQIAPVLEYGRSHQLTIIIHTVHASYVEVCKANNIYYQQIGNEFSPKQVFKQLQEEIVKVTFTGQSDQIARLSVEMRGLFWQWSLARSESTHLDILHPLASKGFALQLLSERFKIGMEQMMAFGNYYNDLDMLKMVGMGIAMQNAPAQVRKVARRITASNNDHGVALIVEELLDQQIKAKGRKLDPYPPIGNPPSLV